jgi:hypothetical protein
MEAACSFALSGAVRAYQPGFPDHGLGAGATQAGGFEIRPGLLRAVAANRVDVEPVGLGKRLRDAGFDLRGETGKNGEGSGENGGDSHGGKRFDHDGPLSLGLWPVIRCSLVTHGGFRDVFARSENGFVAPEFCFVALAGMKQTGLARQTR